MTNKISKRNKNWLQHTNLETIRCQLKNDRFPCRTCILPRVHAVMLKTWWSSVQDVYVWRRKTNPFVLRHDSPSLVRAGHDSTSMLPTSEVTMRPPRNWNRRSDPPSGLPHRKVGIRFQWARVRVYFSADACHGCACSVSPNFCKKLRTALLMRALQEAPSRYVETL
jgi:hypothetical protein